MSRAACTLVCMLALVAASHAFFVSCDLPNNSDCDDLNDQTRDDVCVDGICQGSCPPGTLLEGDECVTTCQGFPVPENAVFVECHEPFVLDEHCSTTCLSPAVPSGDATRTCMADGSWSGKPLVCTLPDACLAQPCSALSTCISDDTNANRYRCECIEDAHGTPGPDGRGCVIPSITSDNGIMITTVSDQDDVLFKVGTITYTVRTFDAQVTNITKTNGIIDTKVSSAVSSLTVSTDSKITSSNSATVATLLSTITAKVSAAVVSAADDATAKSNAAMSTAATDATNKANSALATADTNAQAAASTAKATALSQAQVYDAQTLSSAVAHTESVRTTLTAQLAGLQTSQATTQGNLASTTASLGAVSSAVSAITVQFSSGQSTLTVNANTAASNIVALQNKDGLLTTDVTNLQNNLAATSNAVTSLSASTSSALSTSNANLNAQLASLTQQVNQIRACGAINQVFDPTSGVCKPTRPIMADWASTLNCNTTMRGDTRLNGTAVVVCNGATWIPVYVAPLGSSINPATSCAAIIANGDMVYGYGTYSFRLADGSVAPIVCEGSSTRGGDGQSALKVAASCASIKTYFNIVSGFAYIDSASAIPDSTKALRVYCLNGVSMGGDGSTSALSGVTCDSLATYWGKAPAKYWVAGAQTFCFMTTLTSCQHAVNLIPSVTNGVYNIYSSAIPTWCEFVNGNEGWSLVMNLDGTQQTFAFDASLWSNQATYNPGAVSGGLDNQEYKSALYWQMPFTQMRLGMKGSRTGNVILWGVASYTASNMFSVIADGAYRSGLLDRNTWKYISGSGSLQSYCNRSGFNVRSDGSDGGRIRIGIESNEQNDCSSPDSSIGFGRYGNNCSQDNGNTVGNEAGPCSADNGEVHQKNYGYIMVR